MENGIARVTFEPAVITADFPAMHAELDKALEPYEGVTLEAIQAMPERDVKSCARDLRAMRNELEDARKGVKRAYNEPLARFEGQCKELVGRIDAKLDLFRQVEAANEERRRAGRMAVIEDAYLGFLADNGMDAIAQAVPVERLVEKQWLNKSFAESKAVDAIAERAAKVIADWAALHEVETPHMVECEGVFLDTLDLGAALQHERACRERDERVAAMKAQEEAARAEAEAYRAEEREAERAVMEAVANAVEVEPDPPVRYALFLDMTDAQRDALKAWLAQNGVHGTMALEPPEGSGYSRMVVSDEERGVIEQMREVA